ncbi:hypothetical protein IC220_06235 [Wolbachia endosymbiont of Pentalonia nigronervosa]|jgi:hypothetical protein|uniref:hypothetical protein n=1 Tax=Wolbachia endosymbiont of Pentalonia nigronervosa TaxID=1301914 RepID=UPI00165FF6AC|nr:hypothetical protein [Wolbachia endosymbiont of Pentalonia nigronervosa]MBD0392014.1 hypothetical protein [Wolbachia endosymbiont of Pentalonia nigronervosa]
MAQVQKKLNINVSFEGESAQYLIDIANLENKTVQEILASFVREELEEDKELAEIANESNDDAETIDYKDVKWRSDHKGT